MAAPITIDQIKQWFQTEDTPTQEQFYAWLDSYRHQLDKITIDDLETQLRQKIQSIGSANGYATGTEFFEVTASAQTEFVPAIDITNIPVYKICVSNGVRVSFNKVGNKVVLVNAAHAGDVIYIDVI